MGYIDDPTAYEAVNNVQSKYKIPDEVYRVPVPPIDNRLGIELCKALNQRTMITTDTFVSPYTDIISLKHDDLIRVRKITFSKEFPGCHALELLKIDHNVLTLNVKIPRGIQVFIKYDYKVY